MPTLLVISGLSGSGKSTLAAALGRRLGWAVVNSDVIRKELAGLAPRSRPSEAERITLYGAEMTRRTYDALSERAAVRLRDGASAILDATFLEPALRDTARRLAETYGASFQLVRCEASPEVIRVRLAQRIAGGSSVSDGDWGVYLAQRSRTAGVPDDASEDCLVIDTAAPLSRQVEVVLAVLADAAARGTEA